MNVYKVIRVEVVEYEVDAKSIEEAKLSVTDNPEMDCVDEDVFVSAKLIESE